MALVALYRPGPMEQIPKFIERKHGRTKVEYEHPLMEAILKETYGIMVYQEQVMRIASDLAGLQHGRGGHPAPGHGQEEPRADGRAAEEVRGRRPGARRAGEEGGQDLQPDGAVRRLRLQQVPRGGVRHHRVPDGLPQGQLPGRVHGRPAHLGNLRHGQDRQVHRGMPDHGHRGAAAGRERVEQRLHGGGRQDPLRSGGGQERGGDGHPVHPGGADAARGDSATSSTSASGWICGWSTSGWSRP